MTTPFVQTAQARGSASARRNAAFLAAVAVALACTGPLPRPSTARAQAPTPSFGVLSIKVYRPAGRIRELCSITEDPTVLRLEGCSTLELVALAFDLHDDNVSNHGPAWITSLPFTLEARTPAPTGHAQKMAMLRSALSARFALRIKRGSEKRTAYSLERSRGGPRMQPATSTSGCGHVFARPGVLRSQCITIGYVAEAISQVALRGAPVVDRTGLPPKAQYSVALTFSPDGTAAGVQPTIFKAVVDQLGLRLSAAHTQVPVVLILNASRPPVD